MTDKEYINCKIIIKKWEKKFKEQEKRNPTKEDIKRASSHVRDAYKLFWYIKTSFLQETIIEDESQPCTRKSIETVDSETKLENSCASEVPNSSLPKELGEISSSQRISKEHNSSSPNEIGDISCSQLSDCSYETSTRPDLLNESTESNNMIELVNNETVWGDHLKKVVVSREIDFKKSTSCLFTEKLFKGLKLKKRNPRKSRNFFEKCKVSDIPPVSSDESSQSFPDGSFYPSDSLEISPSEKIFDIPNNINITGGKSLNLAQPINLLHSNLEVPDIRARILKNKIDEGWLDRCGKECELDNSNELSFKNINEETTSTVPSSDEDYVYSSDDETKIKNVGSNPKVSIDENVTVEKIHDLSDEACSTSIVPACQLIGPVEAAKELLKNQLDSGCGGSKRSAVDDPLHSWKKLKTVAADYDSERKMKLLEKKVANGKVNENFVSIDLKRKRFVRGKKGINYSKFKKDKWKMKKKVASMQSSNTGIAGILKCFNCGDVGHFSKQCKKKNVLLPLDEFSDNEESPFPSLEEASEMAKARQKLNGENNEVAEMLEMCDSLKQPDLNEDLNCVPPLCDCNKEENIKMNVANLYEALKKFGYDSFRPGQEKTIMRIISGKSALFISSTGSGKSLCYQIPAYLYAQRYQCMSLVISPLVSLMEDQVINFPSFLKAACIHTNQTAHQRDVIIEKIQNKEISVLLISPEALISAEHGILGHKLIKNFPSVAFVCIDEVHCVSQWSHNFRTSYLMICKVLKERFKVQTFLGLTATATNSTIKCITYHLGIPESEIKNAVIQQTIIPDNLILSVSKDQNKDTALVRLLKQSPFSEFNSIIIYCLRRNECERIASFLRISLEDSKKSIQMYGERSGLSADVEVYHAGISAARRKKVQNCFMNGKLRIVVATVAFGMGINKSDIRGIIHYNMPKTFEHYVQEIGRAGRDGLPARCHLFYDAKSTDLPELKRHIFANSVDRPIIRKLLQKVFQPCTCIGTCEKHELAFSVESTVQELDLGQENISTLLCYLELLPEQLIKLLSPAYTICTVQSFGGVKALQRAAKKCPPLAYAIAEHSKNSNSSKISNKFEFDAVALAEKIKWKSGVVKHELKQCEWLQINGSYQKSHVSVTFREIGFHMQSPGNLTESELDHALDALHNRVISQENTSLDQLDICDKVFKAAAYDTVEDSLFEDDLKERNQVLKSRIIKYFMEENHEKCPREITTELKDKLSVMCNIHRLVSSHKDCNFTGRAVARIFHGIESPNYPAKVWYRSPFWRCSLIEDFNVLCRFASQELVKLR